MIAFWDRNWNGSPEKDKFGQEWIFYYVYNIVYALREEDAFYNDKQTSRDSRTFWPLLTFPTQSSYMGLGLNDMESIFTLISCEGYATDPVTCPVEISIVSLTITL